MKAWRRTAAVAGLAVGVIATMGSGDSKTGDSKPSTGSGDNPAEADVTVSSCELAANEFEGPQAKLSVTNHSSKPSNYLITVAFESADGSKQLDTGIATVDNLAAGQTAEQDASSLKSDLRASAGKFTCKVVNVSRYASG